MSFWLRTSYRCLVLGLFLFSVATFTFPLRASTPDNSDRETIRLLTEQYGLAMVSGDLDKIRGYWNPDSKNLIQQFKSYQKLVAETRLEFLNLRVSRLDLETDKAVSQLTVDERRFDKKTGAVSLTYGTLYGVSRVIEWTKTSAGWKIEREYLIQDELAAKLEKASQVERDQLLEKEKEFVTNSLILALSGRGLRLQVRGEYEAAWRCFDAQQLVSERLGDQVGVAGTWLNKAQNRFGQDDTEVAIQYAQKALAIYTTLDVKHGQALALEKLANFYRIAGDYRRAFDCAQKSLHLMEQSHHRRGILEAVTELALIYGTQNNSEQALAHLDKALAIAQELEDRIQIATLRHDAAVEYENLGRYDRALEIYQQLLKQTESFGDRGGAAMVRGQIGRIFAARGDYATALNYFQEALTALESLNMKRATVVERINISDIYLAQSRYTEALESAQTTVALARETGRPTDLWFSLTSLGYAQLALNRHNEAHQSFEEAVSIVEKLRTQTAGGVEECQRYFGSGLRAHYGLLRLLVKENRSRDALLFAERLKARALLDMLREGHVSVQKAMTVEEREKESKLKSELTQLNRQLSRATQSEKSIIEAQLEKARLNYEAFQNSLYSAHPELKVQRGEAPIINSSELADLVDARTVLLDYVVGEDETFVFATTKDSAKADVEVQVYSIPIKRDALALQAEGFRSKLAARDLGFRTSARKLYDLLLKPAVSQLRGKTNIVIAPDDSLWDLPFQALLTSSNRFLIEDGNIAYTPSLTVLREMTKRRSNQFAAHASPATLLALGNPLVGASVTSTNQTRSGTLDALPEAEREVKALGRLYGASNSRIYIGSEASEDRLKSEASKAKILHFATHGMLNDAAPMYSSLALAQNGPNEDGLLEAWELMQLDLKADLAVLSACETARGRVGAGEGMIGFSWAMFIAGVPSIVVSQWKVESAGTRELMVNFHSELLSSSGSTSSGPAKAEALRQAALKVMKNPETSHPFFWAGFVLVGDGK